MYDWWVFVHLAGVFGFLIAHGVSVGVLFRLRTERDPSRVAGLLEFSGSSVRLFYVSMLVLLVGGVAAGIQGRLFDQGWIWGAIVILVLTSVAMVNMARPYYRRVGLVARAMAGGSEAVTPEQFDEILRSRRPMSVAVVGFVGLAAILYLMVLKPTLGFSSAPAASCSPSGTSIQVVAKGTKFDAACLAAPASEPFTVALDNQDAVPHNISIYTDASAKKALFKGDNVTGHQQTTYQVPALASGMYFFRCDVHPTQMTGTFVVGSSATSTP
jgi:plastocyanin